MENEMENNTFKDFKPNGTIIVRHDAR